MYNQKGISSVNEASKTSFKMHENKSESAMQPKKHMLRSNYQPVWKWSLISNPDTPLPVGYGWQMDGDHLIIDWMDLSPAPDEVLKLTHCSCRKSECQTSACSCLNNELPCSELCKCTDCHNEEQANEHDKNNKDDEDEDEG